MRGTPEIGHHARHTPGIIPAHAGNTPRRYGRARHRRDHPRACGEHAAERPTKKDIMGSSPRMRGTLHACWHRIAVDGIIPAHAGNTVKSLRQLTDCGDHPRACGEHQDNEQASTSVLGSSPRMRGTRRRRKTVTPGWRIIPAHAGNTWWPFIAPYLFGGSSPRMRGTPVGQLDHAVRVGIIPAHAGNTISAASCICFNRDHPRACGEHLASAHRILRRGGSSPRMRGTHEGVATTASIERIIPAHAGNTPMMSVGLPS